MKILQLHLGEGVYEGREILDRAEWCEMHRIQFADEIEAARQKDGAPLHEPWGLGWQIKGSERPSRTWFGFGGIASPASFGHAGISTVMTMADPAHQLAIVFATTNSIDSKDAVMDLRNTVTDLVLKALKTSIDHSALQISTNPKAP